MAGLAGQNIVYCFIGTAFFQYFLTDIALFPPAVVTVLLMIMKIWDGINDPIIGSFVDRHRFKNGEKLRPLLKNTPVPVGIFTVLIFVVFSTDENLLWLRVGYFVFTFSPFLYSAFLLSYKRNLRNRKILRKNQAQWLTTTFLWQWLKK